jgi:hypothetical protein
LFFYKRVLLMEEYYIGMMLFNRDSDCIAIQPQAKGKLVSVELFQTEESARTRRRQRKGCRTKIQRRTMKSDNVWISLYVLTVWR